MSRRNASNLVKALLTGKPSSGNPTKDAVNLLLGITGKVHDTNTGIGGGLAGLGSSSSPSSITAYAPGMRRDESILGPSGHPLGLGLPQDRGAPPVISGGKHPSASGKNLNQMARAAIAAQYDPVIGAVAGSIARTQGQAARAKKQVRRQGNRAVGDLAYLYGTLGREAKRARHQSAKDYHQEIQRTRRSYRELDHETNDAYNGSMGVTAKDLTRLGIDPSVALQGAAKDRAFLDSQRALERRTSVMNERESKHQFGRLLGQARRDIIATGVASIGQSKSATQGALADIANNLADNLAKLQMQQAQLQGQKAGALASQKMASIQARAANNPNSLDNKIKEAQLAKLLGYGAGATSATSQPTDAVGKGLAFIEANSQPTLGPGGRELPPKIQHPVALANILQYITGGSGPNHQTDFAKVYYPEIWQHLVKTGKRHNWTQADMNYLQRAVQISLGI